jgi:predicted AAA+ superfamily ATPase
MKIERELYQGVLESLQSFPVVGLIGPRQVGKTTLVRRLATEADKTTVYLDLERPSDLAKLDDPELYLESLTDRCVIIDEVQQRPDLFPVLRALVDAQRRPGRFLVLGSAAPALIRQSSETLAGRIDFLELAPLSLAEISAQKIGAQGFPLITELWCRGGFPNSYLAATEQASLRWRNAFIRSYLERDIPQLGIRIPTATLRRFWMMLAHYHGQLWNASSIAGSLGVSAPSVRHYLDILENTFMVRVLQPYAANLDKRLVKSPKIYLRDSGLLHALLNLPTHDALMGHPVLGASWEGWVIEQTLAQAPHGTRPYFFRTASGNEIDLLLELPGGHLRAVEIKHSTAPRLGKGYPEILDALKLESGFVIAPVAEAYPLSKRARVLPVQQLAAIWA